jgi:hypothetical protein
MRLQQVTLQNSSVVQKLLNGYKLFTPTKKTDIPKHTRIVVLIILIGVLKMLRHALNKI